MTWLDAAPAVGVAAALLVLPGWLVATAVGLRGVLGLAVAPLLSTAVIGGGAVVAGLVGVRWGPGVVVAAALTAVVVGIPLTILARRAGSGGGDRGAPERLGTWAWVVAGVGTGGAALAAGVAAGLRSPDRWPQTFDAVFHLDAAWHVLHVGDGSSLTLGTMTSPEASSGFYPGAWHDLVALVSQVTGVDVVVSTSAVAVATVGLAWPLSCVAVVRVAVGAVGPALGGAGALAAAVAASPVLLVSYGTLWPNALATALLPAALALVVRGATSRGAPRGAAVLALLMGVPGLTLAHPNATVSLLVLATAAVAVLVWPRGWRARAAVGAWGVALGWLVVWSPVFASTRDSSWGARQTTGQALGEWLALAPERTPVPLVVAVLAVVGGVVAWRRVELRWVLAVHAAAGALWVLVSGSDGLLSRSLSGPWWDDAHRLGALVGVAGVPLAALGLLAVAARVAASLPPVGRKRGEGAIVAALLVGVVVAGGGLYRAETASVVARWASGDAMLGARDRSFVASIGRWVPEGARVVGNPWNGLAFTGPLADREALFPHLVGRWGSDRDLVGDSLEDVARRPEVCAALDRLRVTHVLVGRPAFWRTDPRRAHYAGLDVAGRPGFVLVARGDAVSLWEVTACGR